MASKPMRRVTWLIAVFVFLGLFAPNRPLAQQRAQAGDDLEVLTLQPNVYLIAGAGRSIVVHIGADGVVVVDTGSVARTDQVFAEIRKLTHQPIRYIIDSSADPDHVGGHDNVGRGAVDHRNAKPMTSHFTLHTSHLFFRRRVALLIATSAMASAVMAGGAQGQRGAQPDATPAVLAPPPINWPAPPLPDGPINLETAEVRNLRVVVMSKQLNQPWSIAFLPDGAILVTERPGRLRIFRNGILDPEPVAGVPAVRAAGLQGLMDVVLHPRFAENKLIYLSYHKPVPAVPAPSVTPVVQPPAAGTTATPPGTPTGPGRGRGAGGPQLAGATTIARGTWDGKALTNVKDIFESGATGTESSRIAFGRDGMLYMTISAPGTGPQVVRSQDPGDYAGKTIRLRDDGTIPPDNPFAGRAGFKPAIFTLGHRNGHSLQVNPETGELWASEQGPNGGDEINIIRAGKDYGWPGVSYGRDYMGPRISENPFKEGTEQPVVFWVPSIAVTGMTFYTGDRFPAWKRNIFVGGLRQGETPRTGHIDRITFNEKWEEIRREPILMGLGQRIRDVRQGPDGLLYVVTSENTGALLRLEPGDAAAPPAR